MWPRRKRSLPQNVDINAIIDKAFEGDAFQVTKEEVRPMLQDPDGVLKPHVDLLDSQLRCEGEIVEVEKVIRDTEDRLEDSKKVFAQLVLETNNKLADYRKVLEGLQANLEVLKSPQLAESLEHREPYTEPKTLKLTGKKRVIPFDHAEREEPTMEREANHGQ